MCTAVTFKAKDMYFGRTLDVEVNYKTSVVVCPRNFPFNENYKNHYAICGMAMVTGGFPLFFDGFNEHGLFMAGLNFPGNAVYFDKQEGKNNLAPFELIPYILGKCKNTDEAEREFKNINILKSGFSNIPNSPLHYIIGDKVRCITVEQTKDGLKIYNNPVGALTNNPQFPWHMTNLVNYMNVTPEEAENRMLDGVDLLPFCKGLGGVGIPGDLSSPSRFVRVVYGKNRALTYESEEENVSQFFHILGSVEQTTGLAKAGNSYEETLYTSCCNVTKGIYYYTTYFNSRVNGVNMNNFDLDGKKLFEFPVKYESEMNIL